MFLLQPLRVLGAFQERLNIGNQHFLFGGFQAGNYALAPIGMLRGECGMRLLQGVPQRSRLGATGGCCAVYQTKSYQSRPLVYSRVHSAWILPANKDDNV